MRVDACVQHGCRERSHNRAVGHSAHNRAMADPRIRVEGAACDLWPRRGSICDLRTRRGLRRQSRRGDRMRASAAIVRRDGRSTIGDACAERSRSRRSSRRSRDETAERRRAECMAHIQSEAVAARARPAGARAGHRRLLPRLHQDAGRGVREPRLRRLAARRRRHAAASCGWRTSTAASTRQDSAGWDDADAAARARWPRTCSAYTPGWTETIEYTRRRPAAARSRCSAFNRARAASSRWSSRRWCCSTRNLGWIALSTGDAIGLRDDRGGGRWSKRWRGRRRWRCTRAGWPSRAALEERRQGGARRAQPAWRATSTTRWRRASARS